MAEVITLHPPRRRMRPGLVVHAVADWYAVDVGRIRGPKRTRHTVTPRSVAAYLLRSYLGLTLHETGRELGRRHHTTIMAAVERVQADGLLLAEAREIARRLGL